VRSQDNLKAPVKLTIYIDRGMLQSVRMHIVKLGGSVITDKTEYRAFRADIAARLAQEIARSGEQVIIVHGAGSFGHVLAEKFKLHQGYTDPAQLQGLAKVVQDVRELNLRVIEALNGSGLSTFPIPPSSIGELDEGKLVRLKTDVFDRSLKLGLTPVTFGDVVLDRSRGFGICSGDKIIEWLAKEMRPSRIIFCTDVDGVYTTDPAVDPDAKLLERVDGGILNSLPRIQRCADVTGSIFGKIESMLRISRYSGECLVINGLVPGRLEDALRGEKVIGSVVKED
jgi:isopentenyl phosphate kinase